MILDMRTTLLTYAIVNMVCALVMTVVWFQNRKQFNGISFWLADLALQAGGGILVALRGAIPDLVSIVVANTMLLAGLVVILIGLERFVGKRSRQIHNYVLLGIFVLVATYFTLVQPNLEIRSALFTLMTLIFTFQCCWFMLYRVPSDMRRMTLFVGIVFGIYALVSAVRISGFIISPLQTNDFLKSGTFETLMIILFTILAVGLICGLILMVNTRLLGEVQSRAEEVRRERDRAKSYFDIAGTMLVVIDKKGKVRAINKKGCEILECEETNIVGQDWFNTYTPERMRNQAWSIFNRIIKGEIKRFEYVEGFAVLSTNGEEKQVTWHNSIIKDESGRTIGVLRSGEDISELKRLEEERKSLEQKAQLASRLASIGELASGVAHEINNPLTGVIGYTQFLLSRKDIADDIKEELNVINEGAQRVSSIVKRLLAFASKTKPSRAPVDINNLINGILGLREYELQANNVDVSTSLDPTLSITVGDSAQLQQVFLNLIINAENEMKLSRKKGKLLITTKRLDNNIHISFKDNGPGISRQNLDKIFDPFFTTREVGEGSGLGLSVCYGIVKEHNGRIWADSEKGKGATFTVELPIITKATKRAKSKTS